MHAVKSCLLCTDMYRKSFENDPRLNFKLSEYNINLYINVCIYIDLLIFKFALNICLSPTRAYCFTLPTVEEQRYI